MTLQSLETEVNRIANEWHEMVDEIKHLRFLNAELVAALEKIVRLGISQEAIEIARAALAKVKEYQK